jgi:hypothetical protein
VENIIEYAKDYGLFAVLFVSLLAYVLKTNDSREKRYLGIIDKLADQFDEIKKDVQEIKGIKEDVEEIKFKLVNK